MEDDPFDGAVRFQQLQPHREATYNGIKTINTNATNDEDVNNSLCISIDEAIDRLGYGAFQRRVLLAAGLCAASDAMEILLLSFLALSVQVEWNLSIQQTNTLIAVVFAGAFVGTLLLGRLGDLLGRKITFVITASIVAVFGLVTALCENYAQLLLARSLVGVGIGGVTVPYDTFLEFLPTCSRGQNLALPSYFWTIGTVLVALLAHLTLGDGDTSRWRYLCLGCSVPCILAALFGIMEVPESPRWLLTHKRDAYNAMKIVKYAALLNGRDPDLIFPPGTTLSIGSLPTSLEEAGGDERSINAQTLFSPLWYPTLAIITTLWFCYAFLYYGTVLVVTSVFSSTTNGTNGDEKASIHFDTAAILLSTAAEVAGVTLVVCTIDRIGRQKTHAMSFLFGGVMVLCLCFLVGGGTRSSSDVEDGYKNISMLVSLAFLARMLILSGSSITWVWTAEIFSTDVRSTGHSLANAAARIGGFLAPYFVSPTTPYRVIGLVMFSISLVIVACSQFLPETRGAPLGGVVENTIPGMRKGYENLESASVETMDVSVRTTSRELT